MAICTNFSLFRSGANGNGLVSNIVIALTLIILKIGCNAVSPALPVLPRVFRRFGPFFIITLAPMSLTMFNSLTGGKGRPSTPHGVNVNVIVTTMNFVLLTFNSFNLPAPTRMRTGNVTRDTLISPG